MRKIVFFDIDGTLVDDATQAIAESTPGAIAALRRQGHLAVLNTGRPYLHIDPRVLSWQWDGWVCACGMQVWAEGKRLHAAAPSLEVCCRTRDLARACGLDVIYETEQGFVKDGPWGEISRREVNRLEARGREVLYDPCFPEFRFLKLVTFDHGNADQVRFRREAERDFFIIDRGDGMLELTLRGNTKSTGISILLDYFGLSRSDAFAFGDSTNDLTMFGCVGTGVAMGGSPEALVREAAFVTDTTLADGIRNGLVQLGLIPGKF